MNERTLRYGAALCLVTLVALLGSTASAQVKLEYRYQAGEVAKYDFVIDQRSNISVSEASPSRVSSKLRGQVTLRVARVDDDGTADLEVLFDHFDAELRKDDKRLHGETYEWVIEYIRASWKVAPTGKTVSFVSGSKSKSEIALANLLRDAVLRSFVVFPAEAKKVGDGWSSSDAAGKKAEVFTRLVSVKPGTQGEVALLETTSKPNVEGVGSGIAKEQATFDIGRGAIEKATWEGTFESGGGKGPRTFVTRVTLTRR